MNDKIRKLAEQAGGEFWQRIESDGALNKEAYITFDPPERLEKFAELIVRECAEISKKYAGGSMPLSIALAIKEHFGLE